MSSSRSNARGAALAACLTLASGASADPARDGVISRAHAALGTNWTTSHPAIRISGEADWLGQTGPVRFVFAADGRFARRIQTALPDGLGFDGARTWASDPTGIPRVLELSEYEWNTTAMAVVSGAWTRPAFPFRVAPDSTAVGGNTILLPLLDESGTTVGTMALDPVTFRPTSLSRTTMLGEQTLRLDAWREFDGAWFPTRIEERSGATITKFRIKTIEAPDGGAKAIERECAVPPHPDDAAFMAGVTAELDVRRAPTGHFLVKPRIDGQDVGWFIFDTGAGGSTLSPATARKLGLRSVASVGIMSVLGLKESPIYRAARLTLGPLEIDRPLFVEFDLSPFTAALGEEIAGIVGFDVMERSVVELEVAKSRLALHDPATFDATSLPWRRLHLSDRHPVVEASFESHTGLFKLDLGASGGPFGNVTLHGPAVERLGLLVDRDVRKGQVAGGDVAFGKIAWFELAGHRFESPDVMFATDTKSGPFRDRYTLGNIGVDFMAPFRIVFDYGQQRVAFVERP